MRARVLVCASRRLRRVSHVAWPPYSDRPRTALLDLQRTWWINSLPGACRLRAKDRADNSPNERLGARLGSATPLYIIRTAGCFAATRWSGAQFAGCLHVLHHRVMCSPERRFAVHPRSTKRARLNEPILTPPAKGSRLPARDPLRFVLRQPTENVLTQISLDVQKCLESARAAYRLRRDQPGFTKLNQTTTPRSERFLSLPFVQHPELAGTLTRFNFFGGHSTPSYLFRYRV